MDELKNKSSIDYSQSSLDELAVFHEYNKRKLECLQMQSTQYQKWKESDVKALSQTPALNYEASTVFVDDDINSPPVIAGNWKPFILEPGKRQSISDKIIRSMYRYSLKTLGFRVSLQIELGEQSELWIMSREENKNTVEHSVVKIGREAFTERLFVKLGSHIGPNGEFRFFKTYEVPTNSSNVNIEYSDFGDDTIAIQVRTERARKQLCRSSNFIPVFHPCSLMIAGIGSHIFVKSMNVSQFRRKLQGSDESRCNCNLF